MNPSKHKIVISFIIIVIGIDADDIVSEENRHNPTDRKDKNTYNIHDTQRRFFENLDDDEWHVAHLRDTDFGTRRTGCKEETVDEKMKRYRKSLENDGALVEYVSADTLPVDLKDLGPDVCRIPEGIERIFKPVEKVDGEGRKIQISDEKEKRPDDEMKNPETVDKKEAKARNKEKLDTATTHSDDIKVKEPKPGGKRRTSEYMFSSDEYYDETVDFDVNVCPNDVIEVLLEIDHIRNYDVQCQLILTWRQLE